MFKKMLNLCCYFNYHPKTRLVDVKIGFGLSGKIETVECEICKKNYIRRNQNINPWAVVIIVILFLIILLFF